MTLQISALNEKFGIDGELSFRDAGDGFIVIDISSELCDASIALQGAHLMTWQPKGEEPVIWMSPVAKLGAGKSIRGGVPICWPWFGAHATDSSFSGHGFARTVLWDVVSSSKLDNGSINIAFRIADIKDGQWTTEAPAEMHMSIGDTLELELVTENKTSESITVGDALHTYFTVGDVRNIKIRGLDACEYIDKVDAGARKKQEGHVTIDSEVDRIYLDQGQDVVIRDETLARRICIEKQNSHSTIVWNPWIDKCVAMGDFGSNDGYLNMVCVESANADEDVVQLPAGESHTLWVRYSVEKIT